MYLDQIQAYKQKLEAAIALSDDKVTQPLFSGLLSEGMITLRIPEKLVCDEFGVSPPVVDKWKRAAAQPTKHVKRSVLEWLLKRAKEMLT